MKYALFGVAICFALDAAIAASIGGPIGAAVGAMVGTMLFLVAAGPMAAHLRRKDDVA